MVIRLDLNSPKFNKDFTDLISSKDEMSAEVENIAADIIKNVRKYGDQAIFDYSLKFDNLIIDATTMRFSDGEITSAKEKCDPDVYQSLIFAAQRIKDFHEKTMPDDLSYIDDQGVGLAARWRPVMAAGLYVPGGTASYPSSVLMNAIPANVAGVERIVMVVPAPNNIINPAVLAAAEIAGVTEIYKIGGAQAIAALAYGSATIKPVDKIVGPGNAFVAAAKRLVFGKVGIDMIAGPSEILVIADGKNDPYWIAMDLMSQAEHDISAQSILITDNEEFADAVEMAITDILKTLPRAEIASKSWENNGAVIIVPKLEDAIKLVNQIAPEHLELAIDQAEEFSEKIINAGAIFLGRYTPEAIGDYVAGPNHVLPTAGSAKFSSGLGVLDFMKRTSLVKCDVGSLRKIGMAAVNLATAEGLGAHAKSVAIRLNMPVKD